MKRCCVVVMLLIICISGTVFSQGVRLQCIEPVTIEASMQNTTSLIFPYSITTADWGSNGIIVEQVKAAKNILHIKAARVQFPLTNLSVITSDGQFYAFTVQYDSMPAHLDYIIQKDTGDALAAISNNVSELEHESQQGKAMRSFLHVSKKMLLMTLQLSGVYIAQHAMWLKVNLDNRSWINFPLGYVRFFIKDRRVTKRGIVQDKEMFPVFTDHPLQVEGHTIQEMCFGFSPFTLPKSKRLVIQVGEKGEGRFIELKINEKKLLRAKKM